MLSFTVGSAGSGRLRSKSPQLFDFIEWWGATLATTVPGWLYSAFFPSRNWVQVRPMGTDFLVLSPDGSVIGPLSTSPAARSAVQGGDVLAILSPGEAFLRQRRLPASSEANLRSALRLQIAADTPFEVEEVFEDCRLLNEDDKSGTVLAEQAIVRRDLVRTIQANALEARIDLAGIDLADTDGKPKGFNLLPESERARCDAFLPSLNRALLLAALCLAGLLASLFLVSLDRQASLLEKQVALVGKDAAEVLALHRDLQARSEIITLVEGEAVNPAGFLPLWNEVAAALPEDSWLEGLAYDGREMSLIGLSRSSDGLSEKLENIPGVVAARIVSSVMRDERLEADRFRIELVLDSAEPDASAALTVGQTEDVNG
jgi:Tfp pilus assembly protein PilN